MGGISRQGTWFVTFFHLKYILRSFTLQNQLLCPKGGFLHSGSSKHNTIRHRICNSAEGLAAERASVESNQSLFLHHHSHGFQSCTFDALSHHALEHIIQTDGRHNQLCCVLNRLCKEVAFAPICKNSSQPEDQPHSYAVIFAFDSCINPFCKSPHFLGRLHRDSSRVLQNKTWTFLTRSDT